MLKSLAGVSDTDGKNPPQMPRGGMGGVCLGRGDKGCDDFAKVLLLAGALIAPFTSGCWGISPRLRWAFSLRSRYFRGSRSGWKRSIATTNDYRTPIMPPIPPGFPPPLCEDPPDEAMVLRAMPHVARGVPYVYEEFRDDIQVVSERIVDRIDPAAVLPAGRAAQMHHCHWKCTIYYTETFESGYPFPFRCKRAADRESSTSTRTTCTSTTARTAGEQR